MKTSVVKDGNVFMIHVVDPVEETKCSSEESGMEKSETETQEKDKPGILIYFI